LVRGQQESARQNAVGDAAQEHQLGTRKVDLVDAAPNPSQERVLRPGLQAYRRDGLLGASALQGLQHLLPAEGGRVSHKGLRHKPNKRGAAAQ
jgi:hypothetical protein